jgi:hypothetical protein
MRMLMSKKMQVEYTNLILGLPIPANQFNPNIGDDVKFSYLEKGPTQPTFHNIPKVRDTRRFPLDRDF